MRYFVACVLMIVVAMLFSCSDEQVKKSVYQGLHDRQCIVDKNEPHCDPDRLSYEEYKKQRDKMKKE